ncbi:MAG: DUF3846 domain-containing protein [Lachnospiraceae bacterium]
MELLLEEKETEESQPESVEALLDTVENEELLQILLSTDKKTLQMVVLKMMGYAPKEISHHMELPEQTVYVGILLNGNGKFEGLPLNRALYDDHGQVYDAIAGTFLVVGLTEDDFTSLTPEQIEKFKEKYQSPEVFTLFNGELHVMKMPPQEQKEQKESRKNDAKQKNPAKKKNRSGDAR